LFTFRSLNLETDAADMARLRNFVTTEPVTAQTIIDSCTLRKDEFRVTTLAFDTNGNAVGYRDVDREAWMPPGRFWLKVVVAPEFRHQGLGSQMFEDALCVAREQGATQLESSVLEAHPEALQFARKRGFEIEHHAFVSSLDLTTFDPHRFDDLMERIHAKGFRFFSLAEAGLTDENKHKLYEVNRASALDNPGNNGIFPDFYSFSKNVFEASWFRADTQIIAAHGNDWVGLSAIGIYKDDDYAYNAFTGVLREYRGHGLAQALKLRTIFLARSAGVHFVRTNNDSQNAPMLAINRKLGYKPEPGIFHLVCMLKQN
jgi:GNAT superfamily N-acetyltransferase